MRLVISCTVAFLAILLMLIPVSLWIIHPVKALTGYARAIRDGRSVRRPKLGHGGEMSELATAFEEMRDALEGKQYVEEYVQSLTHEMKSPLAAIRGAAELLDEEMAPEQRKRFLDNIRSESERMQGLVDRMLSLAALEKRKGLMHTELIDVHELLNDVLDSLMPVARARAISIQKNVPDELTLCGEYFLLRQALSNLLRNALDFSPDGAAVELVVRRENERVIFEVLDNGSGIPDYALDRIFERFYSLQRPVSGKKGSGLGLNFVPRNRQAAFRRYPALKPSRRRRPRIALYPCGRVGRALCPQSAAGGMEFMTAKPRRKERIPRCVCTDISHAYF